MYNPLFIFLFVCLSVFCCVNKIFLCTVKPRRIFRIGNSTLSDTNKVLPPLDAVLRGKGEKEHLGRVCIRVWKVFDAHSVVLAPKARGSKRTKCIQFLVAKFSLSVADESHSKLWPSLFTLLYVSLNRGVQLARGEIRRRINSRMAWTMHL